MSNGFRSRELSGLEPLDDGEGPAAPIRAERARALVRAVVLQQEQRQPVRAARARWPRWARTSAIVLAAAGAASAAAAYGGAWRGQWLFTRSEELVSSPATPAPPAPRQRAMESPAPALPPLPLPLPEAENPEQVRAPEQRSVMNTSARKAVPKSAPAPRRALALEKEAEPVLQANSEPEAAGTLAQANAARGARRYADALALYARVIEAHPGTTQAQAARIAAAALALEHSRDPIRAQRLYAEAVSGGGELAAEARFGIAESSRARGDGAGERAALEEFLRRHPDHALARVARQRREELGR